MRIGKDFILFTKKQGIFTCLLLSRTFHEEKQLKDIFVPTPSFSIDRTMITDNPERHSTEMDIIYKYSPFKSQAALFNQFDRIAGDSGTLVVLYNLRRIETGDTELDSRNDPHDLKLTLYEDQREPEHNSLRAYLSILYLNPSMKIYLRGKKVATVSILHTLTSNFRYKYMAKNLKSCAAKEFEKCKKMTTDAIEMLRQAKSEVGIFNSQLSGGAVNFVDKSARMQQRLLSMRISECEERIAQCKKGEAAAAKNKNSPAPLVLYFGMNIHHRNRYGCMIYNNGRLIEMYVKAAVQKERNDLMMKCLGVVGIVDIPYSVLEPTHNKQSFENKREYMGLLKAMNEHMEQYWTDLGIGNSPSGIKAYWKQYGYDDSMWSSQCNNQVQERVKRYIKTGHSVQCVKCLKWRQIEFQKKYMDEGIPDDWECSMHPNAATRSCSRKEDDCKAKEGKLPIGAKSSSSDVKPVISQSFSQQKQTALNDYSEPFSSGKDHPHNGKADNIRTPITVKREVDDQSRSANKVGERRSARTTNRHVSESEEDEDEISSEDDGLDLEPRPKKMKKPVSTLPSNRTHNSKSSSSRPVTINNQQRRSDGAPPMRKPPTKRVVVSDDSSDDDEPLQATTLRERKARTKSDLRKESFSRDDNDEEEPRSSSRTTRNRPAAAAAPNHSSEVEPPRVPSLRIPFKKTNGSAESSPTLSGPAASLGAGTSGRRSDQDPAVVQLQQEKEALVTKLRQMVSGLARKGSTHMKPLMDANEGALLGMDVTQLLNNTWNDLVLKPQRERDNEMLLARKEKEYQCASALKEQYGSFKEFHEDLFQIIRWALGSFEENPDPTFNGIFSEMKKIVGMLYASAGDEGEPE